MKEQTIFKGVIPVKFWEKDELIKSPKGETKFWNKIKSWFGCTPLYICKVMTEPEPINNKWKYELKLITKIERLFWIKYNIINYETRI